MLPGRPTDVMATIEQIMHPALCELYFTNVPILVEGVEDIAFIATYLHLTNRWTEFRKYGCHFITTGGKNPMSRPLAIAKGLNIPTFAIFDGDANETDPKEIRNNERDNSCLLNLCEEKDFEPIPQSNYWGKCSVMWKTNIGSEIKQEIGTNIWGQTIQKIREEFSLPNVGGENKILISSTLEHLFLENQKSTLLDKLCSSILSFSKPVFEKNK